MPTKRFFAEMMGNPASRSKGVATKKYVKRAVMSQIEKKCLNITPSISGTGVIPAAGQIDTVQSFQITQGTGNSNRTGNVIQINKVVARFFWTIPAGIVGGVQMRQIWFVDRQFNGVVPTVATVLQNAAWQSGYNDDYVNRCGGTRFRILSDKTYTLNCPGSTAAGVTVALCLKDLSKTVVGPFRVQFVANASAPTDIVSGEIMVLHIPSVTGTVVQGQHQFYFHDI